MNRGHTDPYRILSNASMSAELPRTARSGGMAEEGWNAIWAWSMLKGKTGGGGGPATIFGGVDKIDDCFFLFKKWGFLVLLRQRELSRPRSKEAVHAAKWSIVCLRKLS